MNTSPTITGGCLCRAVRYEATGTPYHITHCHCEDCRRSTGAPFVTWISVRRENFCFTAGQAREVHWAGRIRSFCSQCGTSLTFLDNQNAAEVDVTVGSFDDPACVTPTDHIWTEDQLPWIQLNDHLPTHRRSRNSTGSSS